MSQINSKLKITPAELQSRTIELSNGAFEMFCNDIGSMLGCDVAGIKKSVGIVTLSDLKGQFKKLVAVSSIKATGALKGNFYLIFDQEAFFTLAGTIVMLPDKVINQNRTDGTLQSAMVMSDAIGEIGNMLVGSWDRVFGTELAGHGHFALSKNFIGNPWTNPEEAIELTMASQLQIISYEIIIKDFAPAVCAVVYPKDLFEGKPNEPAPGTVNEISADKDATSPDAANEVPFKESDMNADKDIAQAGVKPVHKLSTIETQSLEQPQNGEVSDSIRKITLSAAVLPGEFGQAFNTKSVENIMKKDFVWASPDQTVEYAFQLMKENNTDYVLIGQNGALEGVVTKSDIRGAMSPYLQERFAKWRRPLDMATLQIRLKWVMSKPAAGITPDASLKALAKQMNQQKIKMLPVINSKGSVMGVVTAFELLGAFSNLS